MKDADRPIIIVEATGIYFMMCHDGATLAPVSTKSGVMLIDHQTESNIGVQEASRKAKYRAMIYHLISLGYNIALVNGLEFVDTKVRKTPLQDAIR